MKEINEKTVSRAHAGIVISGIIRGALCAICAALTFLYSYFMLSAMNTSDGFWRFDWMTAALIKLAGIDLERDFYRIDFDKYEGIFETFGKLEESLGANWPSVLFFAVIAVCAVACILLYAWARKLRVTVAMSEKD